jgi:hypothetical protein
MIMLDTSFARLGYSNRREPIIPALDIEEILAKRLQEYREKKEIRPLTQAEHRDLKEGEFFLDLVLAGQSIVNQTKKTGVVRGDLNSIEAFNKTYWVLSNLFEDLSEQKFQTIVMKAKNLLRSILYPEEKIVVAQDDLELTYLIFSYLAREPARHNTYSMSEK